MNKQAYQKLKIFVLLLSLFCISEFTNAQTISTIGHTEIGEASYYPDDRNGRITEGGYKYDKNAMTGAHAHYPFGSIVSVRNVDNGKIVQLKIIDRPYTQQRILDVTYAAGQKLDMIGKQTVTVEVILVDTPATLRKKKEKEKKKQLAEQERLKNSGFNVDVSLFKSDGSHHLDGSIADITGYGIVYAQSDDIEFIIDQAHTLREDYLFSKLYIQTGWSEGNRVYRLLIGNFEDKEDASPLLELLKSIGTSTKELRKHFIK
ncbi:RlpA-like double-psi beta-barrel domain-containing protein [Flammeovirga sp. SubArs3]|uniref:RlpA-like double-psi beta-barrel domain-containing protein n=1 Tax=Flammeovirga sp. SubArs3 TaxID=2995316 RepID=UPI00248B9564|nr:RlpA-like double-psi beta-barrel domain-containing protein [Flammeovirga sp. SubArs3]